MNKKGFTLVELLAVITLIAIIAGLAVPNVMTSIENSKKNTFLLDAKRMVAKASSFVSLNKEDRDKLYNEETVIYTFTKINEKNEFPSDPDNGEYDQDTSGDIGSFVAVYKVNNQYRYCICLLGSKRQITGTNEADTCDITNYTIDDGCLASENLTSIDVIKPRT